MQFPFVQLIVVYTNDVTARMTVLGKASFITLATIRSILLHDVSLSTKNSLTFKATKVLLVPTSSLSFRELAGKNELKKIKKFNNLAGTRKKPRNFQSMKWYTVLYSMTIA